MDAGATTTMTTKLLILNQGEYDLWLMRIEQYFLMTDYSLWEVIKNGNKVLTKPVGSSEQTYKHTTTEEKQDRRNEMKARGTLLMALPYKDQVKLQKLISQLELQGGVLQQEDTNLKLLRSLPSEWKTRALIWRNIIELETISMDDLYNNLKIYEPKILGSSNTNQNPKNMAFVSSNSTSSTNEVDITASGVSTTHTQENAMIAQHGIGGYDWSYQAEEETPTNYAFMALASLRSSSSFDSETKKLEKAEKERDELKLTLEKYQNSSKPLNTLLETQVCDKVKTILGYKAASPDVEDFVNSSKMIENQENVKSRSDKGYHAVPPPYTGNYIPPKPDLMFIDEHVESESVDVVSNILSSLVKTVESKVESVDVKRVCTAL
nr:hypothetical protein [Tanacetum cinerariifolium]